MIKFRDPTRIQKSAGAYALVLGVVMIMAWLNFMTQASGVSVHGLIALATSVVFLFAGVAMFLNWPKGPVLFLVANGALVFMTMFALYGDQEGGHSFYVKTTTIFVALTTSLFGGLIYGWEHFVLKLDEDMPPSGTPVPRVETHETDHAA